MTMQTVRRPSIPAAWYRPSVLGTIGLILYAAAWYVLPAYVGYEVAISNIALIVKILLIVPLTVMSGYGLQMMGFIGHEGFHLSLHSNKIISGLIGMFFSSAIITYCDMGAMMQHWSHHRFTNQASDPDMKILTPLKTWWQRILFARLLLNYHYFKTTLNGALGHPWPFPYMMPFDLSTVRNLCWLNFAFVLLWIGIYISISLTAPLIGLFSIALPTFVGIMISGGQMFLDHAGLGDNLFQNSWSRTSPLMTFLYAGTNFHLEHHLYPGVPCYRLFKVHQLLQESGIYQQTQATIEPSFIRAYSKLAAEYSASQQDSSFDPFKPAIDPTV